MKSSSRKKTTPAKAAPTHPVKIKLHKAPASERPARVATQPPRARIPARAASGTARASAPKALPIYQGSALVCVRARRQAFGVLSRFSGSQPVFWPPERETRQLWLSAEHLFQAARFPRDATAPKGAGLGKHPLAGHPLRLRLRHRKTPLSAYRLAKRYAALRRTTQGACDLDLLRWALEVRFYWNHHRSFGRTLLATAGRPIVWVSRHDTYWGALEIRPGFFQGHNHYGRLLAEVRDRASAILAGELTSPDGFLEPQAA